MELVQLAHQELTDFMATWPIDRLHNLTLEEYTNDDRETAFIYWLEKRTKHTGSIYGGSAFKFGIYRRRNKEFTEKHFVKTDGTYAWMSKYGNTKEEAFANVKSIILQIVAASTANNLQLIDDIDLGDAVKWKIAFLYNPQNIIPIFNPKVLERAAYSKGLAEDYTGTVSALHRFLLQTRPEGQTTIQYAMELWSKYSLDNIYATVEQFLEQAQTDNIIQKGYPALYRNLQVRVSFGKGNVARIPWIAFLKAPNKVLDGIYPVLLYFKADNILVLSYGKSESHSPQYHWEDENSLQTIDAWFKQNRNKRPERYGTSYIKAIYDLSEELDPTKIQTDLDSLIDEYLKIPFDATSELNNRETEYNIRRTWLISLVEDADKWEDFYEQGIIGFVWDRTADFSRLASSKELQSMSVGIFSDRETAESLNVLPLWQFAKEMKPGDIIIAKRGTSEYLGYGIVTSEYYFKDRLDTSQHQRKVAWQKKGVWEENVAPIVLKTLTDITNYPDYVDRLKRLIGIEQEATVDIKNIEYFWLNANPKFWRIEDYQVGQEQSYTTHNEKGNKRTRFEYFQSIKPGDLLLGYQTSPIQKVVAIFEVTQGAHLDEDTGQEEISFKIQKFLPNPVSYETLKTIETFQSSEVMKNNQGSLFKLTKEEFTAVVDHNTRLEVSIPSYTLKDAAREIFLDSEQLQKILNTIRYKKNIILQGPPGVGKTFMAKRIAYLFMEEKDKSKIEMIQFHQSYSYEDFIQGYRPKEDGTFKLENGVFYRFCKRAQADPESDYFFIIDEINRGNLSKIFGELMLLIEADKRGLEHAVSLTYTPAGENNFYIPANVYIIGTMNTADRSLAMVDYALRRRFAFISIAPAFNDKFKEELINAGVDEGIIDPVVGKINFLNKEIQNDTNLGKGFEVGHSYFCNVPSAKGDIDWYNNIVTYEIAPLLQEYWFDNEEKATLEINRLFL